MVNTKTARYVHVGPEIPNHPLESESVTVVVRHGLSVLDILVAIEDLDNAHAEARAQLVRLVEGTDIE